jgi:hypothetical protein
MLSPEDIKRFDKMKDEVLHEKLKFHENLGWMIIVGLFCLVIKDGWFGIVCLIIYGIYGLSEEIKVEEYYNTVVKARREQFKKDHILRNKDGSPYDWKSRK